tara:strand:- start:165 stop:1178 length:1014 start_codon:yes stop_codon:yes gene_type:complete
MNNQKLRLLSKKKKKITKKKLVDINLVDQVLKELSLSNIDPKNWNNQQRNMFILKITSYAKLSIDEQLNFEFKYPYIYYKYINLNNENSDTETIIINREDINIPNIILQTIYNFNETKIKGDGNCFYRCISYFIYNSEEEFNSIRNLVRNIIFEWLNSEESIKSLFGVITKKTYILNEFYYGIVDELKNYQVIGFNNILFEDFVESNKIDFIKFWANIIKLGETEESKNLLHNNLLVDNLNDSMNFYFYRSKLKDKNNIVAPIFWGNSELLFLLANYLEINFTIIFKNMNYLKNKFEWAHKSFIYNEENKIYYLKFTGAHYNILNMKDKINTKIVNK